MIGDLFDFAEVARLLYSVYEVVSEQSTLLHPNGQLRFWELLLI